MKNIVFWFKFHSKFVPKGLINKKSSIQVKKVNECQAVTWTYDDQDLLSHTPLPGHLSEVRKKMNIFPFISRSPTPPPGAGQSWFDFDDSRVRPIRTKEIEGQFSGKESAYMLFYRRKSMRRTPEGLYDASSSLWVD